MEPCFASQVAAVFDGCSPPGWTLALWVLSTAGLSKLWAVEKYVCRKIDEIISQHGRTTKHLSANTYANWLICIHIYIHTHISIHTYTYAHAHLPIYLSVYLAISLYLWKVRGFGDSGFDWVYMGLVKLRGVETQPRRHIWLTYTCIYAHTCSCLFVFICLCLNFCTC